MTKPSKREKYLERIHILRTLINYGDLHASDLADRANAECDGDAFDALPEISRRGIGQKLLGMEREGLVYASYLGAGLPSHWGITPKGRKAAEIFDREEFDANRETPLPSDPIIFGPRWRRALEEIRDADPVDMALDPGWAARIAGAALGR